MAAQVRWSRSWGTVPSCPSLGTVSVTLVLGGVRSGKSRYAEEILSYRLDVTYVAAGARPADAESDPEWAGRVRTHQQSRPVSWRTIESVDLVGLLHQPGGPLLIDCLGTWLASLVDRAESWDDLDAAADLVHREVAALIESLQATSRRVVIVSNEVGASLVPLTASGRFFQDELGRLNTAVADVADQVALVVAGRVLDLTEAPRVPRVSTRPGGPQDRPRRAQVQDGIPQDHGPQDSA